MSDKLSQQEFTYIVRSAGLAIATAIKHTDFEEANDMNAHLLMQVLIYVEDYYKDEGEEELDNEKMQALLDAIGKKIDIMRDWMKEFQS